MSGQRDYRVEAFRGVFVTEKLPTKDMLDINRVAVMLGTSVSTLRRMIREGAFPRAHIWRGTTAHWQRQDVRAWQQQHITLGGKKPSKKAIYDDLDQMDIEEEKDFSRKPLDVQAQSRSLSQMTKLLEQDPKEFARQYPNLAQWARERRLRIAGSGPVPKAPPPRRS
jgi:predicted DNA-binding transcriptional regulator AlpA